MAATGSTDDGAAAEAGEEDAAAAGAESEVRRYKAFKVMLMDCGCRPLPARPLDAVSGTGMPSSTQPCGCARLAEANATAAHSVNVGADILTMLGTQREQLINTRETLAEQRSALDRGGALVSKMLRRAATNKLVLKGTVVLLIALIIIILVAKYWPQSHHHHS